MVTGEQRDFLNRFTSYCYFISVFTTLWSAARAGGDVRAAERRVPSCLCETEREGERGRQALRWQSLAFTQGSERYVAALKTETTTNPSTFPYEVSSSAGITWLWWILSWFQTERRSAIERVFEPRCGLTLANVSSRWNDKKTRRYVIH